MESLAYVVIIILLILAALLVIPLVVIWRYILKTHFPKLSRWWWLIWMPGLLVIAYFLAVLAIRILLLITN